MSSSIRSDFNNPSDRISDYLKRLEVVHDTAKYDIHKMDLLKYFYYEKYVIKSLPESYVRFKKGYIKELGLDSKKDLTEADKKLVLYCIREEQKQSLDKWMDFLSNNDKYPTLFKYYLFQGIVKVGNFNSTIREFTKLLLQALLLK